MSFAAKIAATWLCVVGTPGPVKTGKAYSITGEWSKHRDYNWQIK
jgi:hypothetical protein